MASDDMFSESEQEFDDKEEENSGGESEGEESEFAGSGDEEEGDLEEGEFEAEDESDDEPLIKRKKTKAAPAADSEDDFIEEDDGGDGSDDYTDSDDDVPLSKLKSASTPKKGAKAKKPTAAKKKSTTTKSKTVKSKTKPASKSKKPTAKTKTTPKKDTFKNSSGMVTASSELYQKCEKGKLIQSALCRWWYAMEWPDPSCIPATPPPNHDSLEGFPGVYVCTKGDNVGKIIDYRNKDTCPNFVNFAKKPAVELQDFVLRAIRKQREDLIESEGSGTACERDLNILEKWVKQLNPSKADKEAEKVLKAAKIKLQ